MHTLTAEAVIMFLMIIKFTMGNLIAQSVGMGRQNAMRSYFTPALCGSIIYPTRLQMWTGMLLILGDHSHTLLWPSMLLLKGSLQRGDQFVTLIKLSYMSVTSQHASNTLSLSATYKTTDHRKLSPAEFFWLSCG